MKTSEKIRDKGGIFTAYEWGEWRDEIADEVAKLERQVATLRRVLDDAKALPYYAKNNIVYGADADAVECQQCGGYAEGVSCTPEEIKEHGCGGRTACCARAFVCELCDTRIVGSASAPEME